jgi:hypothetical protein
LIYIEINKDNSIGLTHYMPFDEVHGLGKTKEELEESGLLVESLPISEDMIGKSQVLKYDETKGLHYEYVDRQLTPEEKLEQVQEKQELMQQAIDDLIFGGAL